MKVRRLTTAQWMGLIAILGVNAALVRAFVVQEMFIGGIFMLIALQVGLLYLLRGREKHRRFWSGFELCGMAAVLILFSCDFLPDSGLTRVVTAYTLFAEDLAFTHLPTSISDGFDDNSQMLLAVIYFAAEMIVALLGGIVVSWLGPFRPLPDQSSGLEEMSVLIR